MESTPSSSLSSEGDADTNVPACLHPVVEVRSKPEKTLDLKRKRKEEDSPLSEPDREMKSSKARFPDVVVAEVPKNQKSSPRPAQNSKRAQMKQQESPELRYVKPKDSGKKHHHTSSFSADNTTPSPETAVSENTRIHKPGALALGVVNQKPRAESSYEAEVLEKYCKPGPRLDMSDAVLSYSKELWGKYDASFRAHLDARNASFRAHLDARDASFRAHLNARDASFRAQLTSMREDMGEYHTSFRELMSAVFSRNPVNDAKALNKYTEKYFSFPEGGSETAQLVTIRGTRLLKCNQKGGHHLRGRRMAAKKLRARVIAKILKKAIKVMRSKKKKEMPPSEDFQTGASENGEVETGSLGGTPAAPLEPENGEVETGSLGGSPAALLEPDVEDDPVEEPPNDPNPDVYMERVRSWQRESPRFRGTVYNEEFRFVNLERINSAEQVIEAVHRGIQMVLDDINVRIGPDDYVQLRLDGCTLNNPLFSVRRNRDVLSAEDFLNQASKLLQSNREVHIDGTLRLVVTVVKNMGGGAHRVLNSILNSQIIHKKRQCLVDLAYTGTNLCFAGGLLAVMSDPQKPTDAELLDGARKLHEKLGWSEQKKGGTC
ncbi:uncharacterized protein [Emydura macquarii macquarii]|uniref:uncharacterized protein n=1 Tax=Emydura macquarii macquarii TaxID=1129001 RepID=UPI00352A4384